MYTPNIPCPDTITVATDAALEGRHDDAAAIIGVDPLTTEDAEEWLDNLTLTDVLAFDAENQIVAWNGECDWTQGEDMQIVVRDHRGFERAIARIVDAMIDRDFSDVPGPEDLYDDRFIDGLVWDADNVHSGDDTEICCECHNTLIHADPYGGRATSVFVDGDGFMCEECCQADPVAALHYAASYPDMFSGSVEDFVDIADEETTTRLHETGWRRVVVLDNEAKRIVKKKETAFSYRAPSYGPLDGFASRNAREATYRAKIVWWSNRRLCDLRW